MNLECFFSSDCYTLLARIKNWVIWVSFLETSNVLETEKESSSPMVQPVEFWYLEIRQQGHSNQAPQNYEMLCNVAEDHSVG